MMIQHIRLQVLIALSGIVVMLTMIGYISTNLETVLQPEPGGSYIEGIPSFPDTLNPLYLSATNQADQAITALLFEGLTRPDESSVIQPSLAASWEISEDSRTYTFHLREGVLWHDGTAFTAEDVAFTVNVIQDPAFTGSAPAIELWRTIEVEVVDPLTIRFILPEDVVPFAPFLSFTTFGILPSHLLAGVPVAEIPGSPFSQFPIGTGPWRIVRVEGEQIVLEPHQLPDDSRPMLAQLILRFYDAPMTALEALDRGEVMGVAQVPPEEMSRALSNSSLVPYTSVLSGYTAIFFNLRNPLFQRQPVREALFLGLDRQALIANVLDGQGVVAHSFLMPTHWAYDATLPRYTYQPDEARQMLDQEGWVDSDGDGVREREGEPIQFTILTIGSEPKMVEVVEEVMRQWAELGIRAQPQLVGSAAELRDALRTRDFDLFILSTPSSGLPSDPDFYPLWHSSQIAETGQNYTSFATEAADRLLVEARFTLDPDERRAIYNEFQTMLARDLPALPLYHPIHNYVVNEVVKEIQVGPLHNAAGRFNSLPNWYLKTQRLLVERDR